MGNSPTNATDPSGLWKRTAFRRVGEGYEGWGIAECDDEDLYKLAYLVTGSRKQYDGKWTKKIKKGDRITVKSLLQRNEIRLRSHVVAATSKFSGKFPIEGQSFECGKNPLNAEAIDGYFGGGTSIVDCLGAARLVEAKGLVDFLLPGEFDQLYSLNSLPFESLPRSAAGAKPGDWGYIKNDRRYLTVQPGGGYQGENVIKVGNDNFWGFPGGTHSLAGWTKILIGAYNQGLKPAERISAIPGWLRDSNRFLNVAVISMDAFDLRNGS